MSTRRTGRKRAQERVDNRMAMVTITAVVFSMALAVNFKVGALKKKEAYYAEREQIIAAQLAEEEDRAVSLEQYSKYVHTQEYVEKTAKEKLGLVNPDEVILKPEQ